MNRQSYRVLLLAGVCLIILLALGLWYRSSSPQSSRLLGFNPPGCELPCVMGITPGKTNFDQALIILASAVPKEQTISAGQVWIKEPGDDTRLFIRLEKEDPRIGNYPKQVDISTDGKGQVTTLGKMLEAGYVPIRVFRSAINGPNTATLLIAFNKEQSILATVVGTGQVSTDSPIREVTVLSNATQLDILRVTGHFDDEINWNGFAAVEQYLRAPAK